MAEYIDRSEIKYELWCVGPLCSPMMVVRKKTVDSIPSADVAPVVHGRWAHLGGDEWGCTNCGEVIHTEGSWEKPDKKFCHECGARMDGEDNGRD